MSYRLSRPCSFAGKKAVPVFVAALATPVSAAALEFPGASYAAEGWMKSDGRTSRFEQHIDWDQKRMRMVMAPEGREATTVIVYDMTNGAALMFQVGDDLPDREKVAIRTESGDSYEQMRAEYEAMADLEALGERTVNGESCTLYQSAYGSVGSDDEEAPGVACITGDGIVLQYLEEAGGTPVLEVTRVTRGSQDPGLFEIPPGYRTMDTGNLGSMMSGLMGAGQQPSAPQGPPDGASEAGDDGAGAGEAVREGLKGLFNRWKN